MTARRLQAELGGEIVFFYHDSEHDPREAQTTLRHQKTDTPLALNFAFANKIQRRFSPLFAKKLAPGWRETTARQLPAYVPPACVEAFKTTAARTDPFLDADPALNNVADFCLSLYRALGLLDGVRIVRSGDPSVRSAACAIDDYFVDVVHEGELVRARRDPATGALRLHQGGDSHLTLPPTTTPEPYPAAQISPARDSRLRWMQLIIGCTHSIAGAGEQAYLNVADAPEITFVPRDPIDRSDEAYTEFWPGG